MTNYLQLHSHFVNQTPGAISVDVLRSTITLTDGTTVSWQLPCLPIGGGLVLVPAVFSDGAAGVRVDFSQWTPGHCYNGVGALLPYTTRDQAQAVRVARAFHNAPDATWKDPQGKKQAWIESWNTAQDRDVTPAP